MFQERLGRVPQIQFRIEVTAQSGEHDLAALVARAKPFCWVSNMLSDDLEVSYVSTVLDPPRVDAR